jgi:hypothetical protein
MVGASRSAAYAEKEEAVKQLRQAKSLLRAKKRQLEQAEQKLKVAEYNVYSLAVQLGTPERAIKPILKKALLESTIHHWSKSVASALSDHTCISGGRTEGTFLAGGWVDYDGPDDQTRQDVEVGDSNFRDDRKEMAI